MAFDNVKGVQLPGPGEQEPYIIGTDYRGVLPDMSSLPTGMGMGVEGGNTGVSVPDSEFDSYATDMFNDGAHPDGSDTQVDQMRGIAGGTPPVEILANDQMYSTQSPLPFPPIPETANPELTD